MKPTKTLVFIFFSIILIFATASILDNYKNLKRLKVSQAKQIAINYVQENNLSYDKEVFKVDIFDNFLSQGEAEKFILQDNNSERKFLGIKEIYSNHKILNSSEKNYYKVVRVSFDIKPIIIDSINIKNLLSRFLLNSLTIFLLLFFIIKKQAKLNKKSLVDADNKNFLKFIYISIGYVFLYFLISYFGFHYYKMVQFEHYLMNPIMRFGDWLNDSAVISNNSPYLNSGGWHLNSYPPFTYFQVNLINYLAFGIREVIYIIFLAIFYLLILSTNIKNRFNLSKVNILFLVLLTSYPFLFTLDRGNITILAFFWLFAAFCISRKSTLFECVFIALAGATKIYPSIILFKYLFEEKKKKYFFIGGIIIFLVSVGSLFTFEGGIVNNILKYKELLSERSSSVSFSNGQPLWFTLDLWSFVQILTSVIISIFNLKIESIKNLFGIDLLSLFNLLSFSLFIYFTYFIEKNKYSDIKKITFYLLSVIFIMPYSYDYHLMFILIPIFLLIITDYQAENKKIFLYLILLSLPKRFLIVPIGNMGIGVTELGCIINPILILILYYEIFRLKPKVV